MGLLGTSACVPQAALPADPRLGADPRLQGIEPTGGGRVAFAEADDADAEKVMPRPAHLNTRVPSC